MPQYITLSPDEIMGDYLDGDVHSGTDVLTTGVTIEEAVQAVLDGTLEPSDIPMVEVERHAGQWYCVDNRPLAVFRRLHQVGQCGNIKVKVVSRRGQGQQDLADDFGDLKITVGEKGSRKVQVQQEDPVVNNVKEVNSTRVKGRRSQDDGGFSRPGSKTERPNSSLGRTALSKSLPSRHPVLSAVSSSPGSRVSPATKRSPLHAKSTDSPSMSRSSHRTTTTEHPQNGRTYRSAPSEVQNGRSSVRSSATHTPLSRSSGKTDSSKSPSFLRSGSGRGSSINSNFVRSGSGRGTGIISTFVRSGSGRGYVPGSTPTTSRALSSNSNTNNFTNKAPTKPSSSTSRGNGTSSRLSSASFTSGEKRQATPKTNSKPMSTSHSSTSTSSSNGPDEPRTLSEQEIQQGSESDDELLFVFDGHGNSQRLPIDMLVETDRHLRTLNHRCWKCRKYFQSKQELWIHKQQTNH